MKFYQLHKKEKNTLIKCIIFDVLLLVISFYVKFPLITFSSLIYLFIIQKNKNERMKR